MSDKTHGFIHMQNARVLITGGGRNIGRAMALGFAEAGADVAVIGLTDEDALKATCAECEKHGRKAYYALGDIADPTTCPDMVARLTENLGGLDCLINNAAIRKHTPFMDMDFDEWRRITAIVLDGAFLVTRAAMPALLQSTNASVLNFGGASAHVGAAERAHVITAKRGLEGMTRALAVEFANKVRFNCIVPGQINTARKPGQPRPDLRDKARPFPIGGEGTPEDIAGYALFLASSRARYITGQTIHVSGGLVLS